MVKPVACPTCGNMFREYTFNHQPGKSTTNKPRITIDTSLTVIDDALNTILTQLDNIIQNTTDTQTVQAAEVFADHIIHHDREHYTTLKKRIQKSMR
jgi:hypothetical protein